MIKGRDRWAIFKEHMFSSDTGLDVAIPIKSPEGYTDPFEALGEDVPKAMIESGVSEITMNRLNVTVPKKSTKIRHSFQISKTVSDRTKQLYKELLAMEEAGTDVSQVYIAALTNMPGYVHANYGPQRSLSYALEGFYMVGYDLYLDFIMIPMGQEVSVQSNAIRSLGISSKDQEHVKVFQTTDGNADKVFLSTPQIRARGTYFTGNPEKARRARNLLENLLQQKEQGNIELLFEIDSALYKEISGEVAGCNALSINPDGVIYGVLFDKTDPRIIETPLRVSKEVQFQFADVFNLPTNKDHTISFFKCTVGDKPFFLIEHARGYTIAASGR